MQNVLSLSEFVAKEFFPTFPNLLLQSIMCVQDTLLRLQQTSAKQNLQGRNDAFAVFPGKLRHKLQALLFVVR